MSNGLAVLFADLDGTPVAQAGAEGALWICDEHANFIRAIAPGRHTDGTGQVSRECPLCSPRVRRISEQGTADVPSGFPGEYDSVLADVFNGIIYHAPLVGGDDVPLSDDEREIDRLAAEIRNAVRALARPHLFDEIPVHVVAAGLENLRQMISVLG